MEKRKRISANIRLKKYVLSWFILLIAFIITKYFNLNRFWDYTAWVMAILIFLLYISLKKVEYSNSAVFFNGKCIAYESIIGLKVFEINNNPYYLFITDSKHLFDKYHLTQLGGLNYLSIFKILFSKEPNSEIPLAEFLELLEEKSNIKKNIR